MVSHSVHACAGHIFVARWCSGVGMCGPRRSIMSRIRQAYHYERLTIEHNGLLFNRHKWRRILLLLITHNTPLARGCHDGSPFGSVTWTWSIVTIFIARLLV